VIYMEPGDRRADTLGAVNEGRIVQNNTTGEYAFVGGSVGWLAQALDNLVAFEEAGLIETERLKRDGWARVSVTDAGKYLFRQWRNGPPRAVVELPGVERDSIIPKASEQMLVDAGWSILNAWKVADGWVVELMRVRDEDKRPEEKVLLLDARGLAYRGLSRVDAHALGAAIVAAAR
jgi:DNA-binding PadR family transcriptional regulator